MKVKDVIDKLDNVSMFIRCLEMGDLSCAGDVIEELKCYANILRNMTVKEGGLTND